MPAGEEKQSTPTSLKSHSSFTMCLEQYGGTRHVFNLGFYDDLSPNVVDSYPSHLLDPHQLAYAAH